MTPHPVALIAHTSTSPEHDPAFTSRAAVAVAMALLLNQRRVLLHTSPDLLLPILLAARPARAPLVLEKTERPRSPIVLMSGVARGGAGKTPESALGAEIVLGPGESEVRGSDVRRRTSLIHELAVFGIVDRRDVDEDPELYQHVFLDERPNLIIAMGRSPIADLVLRAAEDFGARSGSGCKLGWLGSEASFLGERSQWVDLTEVAELRWDEGPAESFLSAVMVFEEEPRREPTVGTGVEWGLASNLAKTLLAVEKLLRRD